MTLALLAAGALLLAMSERWLAPQVAAGRLPSGHAQWIWAAPDGDGVTPLAFEAARDFTLDTPPGEAVVHVLADEEYVLFVNGVRVGGNRYHPGSGLDSYRVGSLLQTGVNRLLVELRSGRRAGGLLLRLVGDGGLEVVTGPEWRILRRHREKHLDPANPLVEAKPPRVWGGPPTGRWRLPEAGAQRPLHGDLLVAGPEGGEGRLWPLRMRVGGVWQAAAHGRLARSLPSESRSLGRMVTFDWGRQVTAYVGLVFGTRQAPKALLYFGCGPVDVEVAPDDRALGIRGRLVWTSATPRRFRCVTAVAPRGVRRAFALEVDESRAAALLTGDEPVGGVFGLDEPPPLVTPVEHEIRRELQGLPGLVGR